MPSRPVPEEDLRKVVAALTEAGGNQVHAARALGMSRSSFRDRLDAAQRRGLAAEALVDNGDSLQVNALRAKVLTLEKELRFAAKESLDAEYVKAKILGLVKGAAAADVPDWVLRPESAAFSGPGVPTLLCSDLHWGEVVDPRQIGGVNKYNVAIANERLRAMVEVTIDLLFNHLKMPQYPGIVFALGGDMVTGDIHEELSATNEAEIMPVVLDLWAALTWCIQTLADKFGRVFVPAVTGNHGRNTLKIRAKGRNYTNFDWLIYQFLAKRFEADGRVTFLIPDGPDAYYSVLGHRYLLTHGDQFRGGDGMIGALGPLCVAPETLVLKSDLRYVRADALRPGDEIVGFDEEGESGRRKFQTAYVEETAYRELECYEIETDDGVKTVASVDHPWLCRSGAAHAWIQSRHLRIGTRVLSLGAPWSHEQTWDAGYLAGVLDGEGSLDAEQGRLAFSQQDNACREQTLRILDARGIPYRAAENGAQRRGFEACYATYLFQGRGPEAPRDRIRLDSWRLLGTVRPERLIAEKVKKSWEGVSVQVARDTRVIGIRYLGARPVAAFSTSTKTFIGNGALMHNTRGDHKKRSRNAQIDMDYDTMLCGHWHQLIQMERLIVNGCFPAGSLVATADGVRPIQEVSIGDEVLSRDGTIQTITHVFEKASTEGLVHLKVRGLPAPLTATPNHFVWAIKGETRKAASVGAKWDRLRGAGDHPQWVPADFISPGDYVHIPRRRGEARPIDLETAWAWGLYLAEGHTLLDGGASKKHNRVCLTMHERELPVLQRFARWFAVAHGVEGRVFLRTKRSGGATSEFVVSPGRDTCVQFRERFGHLAGGKHLPTGALSWAGDISRALVQGWIDGDGHTTPAGVTSATTVSPALAYGMFDLALRAGWKPSMASLAAGGRRKSTSYTIHFNEGQEAVEYEGELFYRVHARYRDRTVVPVYDLEVSGEHTYTVAGVGVHNSLKGYDEYASANNFPFEPPRQALWLNHPEHGITFRAPVDVERKLGRRAENRAWVAVK